MTAPVLWATVFRRPGIARAQALVRGWLLRKRLALSGPGVLRRKDLANDEELVSCEAKERLYPFEYFAFEEAGKVWWFSFDTLWTWCRQSDEPTNPYTKVPLSSATRRRLRDMWGYRHRHRIPLPVESLNPIDRLTQRWNILTQAFRDNGFVDVRPDTFLQFTGIEIFAMFTMLYQDLCFVISERDPHRDAILRYCRRGMASGTPLPSGQYVLQGAYILMVMMSIPKNPYSLIFSVLSAYYRC